MLYAILQFIEEFTGMVTVKFFENGKLYNTIDIPMSNDLLKKFDESQLKSSVSRIKLRLRHAKAFSFIFKGGLEIYAE